MQRVEVDERAEADERTAGDADGRTTGDADERNAAETESRTLDEIIDAYSRSE